jgi:membrane associated rhomboid family serine protease
VIPLHDDNPTDIKPYVTIGLIAACVLVYLWQLSLGEGQGGAIYALGVIPAVLFDTVDLPPDIDLIAPVLTPITSMFLHGGFMHLGGNMLYLWIFGNNIEDAMCGLSCFTWFVALRLSFPKPCPIQGRLYR